MDARLSISNMTTEWGPLVGWFPVDEITLKYLHGVHEWLQAIGAERFSEEDLESKWARQSSAPGCGRSLRGTNYAHLSQVTPHVSGPDTVQAMQSLAEIEQKKVAIQKAYLISCVNSRLEDLAAAAKVLKGQKVAPAVKFY